MEKNERALCRRLFKLKVFESDGQAFEDLFTLIMNYAEPEFRSIKPWGKIGDRKNDGYIKSRGIYYQVYAPENIQKSYPDVVSKLEADFTGLIKQWSPINEFYFVVNDKYKGVNADCEKSLESIRQNHGLKSSGFKTAKDLENLLFDLADDQIYMLVGSFDPASTQLDYSALGETLHYILGQSLPRVPDSSNRYPDWDVKVKFNDLGENAAKYLNHGSFQLGLLDAYLENQGNFFAEEVKDKLRELYFSCAQNLSGDELFWNMVESICPKPGLSYQMASIVIMAKYFETCDIFEESE
ncbi:MAG: hypothetical protein HYV27_21875 [Candidatus Hydrogenedentes bacterium]|nr:hypothetical protein [Candidatus Hydrogenedentota bacterium]